MRIKECKIFKKKCKCCGEMKYNINFPKIRKSYFNRENVCYACRRSKLKKITKICPCCKTVFETHRKDKIYCSEKCYHDFKIANRIICYCEYCGKELHLPSEKYERSKRHFCDKTCSGKYHIKEKNPSYNPNLDEEDRKLKRRIFGYRNFRDDVLRRDMYTCQVTGDKNCVLEVHHLDGYDNFKDLRLNIENAITISKQIHALFHKIYGYGDNTKEQFIEFVTRFNNKEFNDMPIPR